MSPGAKAPAWAKIAKDAAEIDRRILREIQESQQVLKEITGVVHLLPRGSDERRFCYCRYIQGMTIDEFCKFDYCSRPTVYNYMWRALKALADMELDDIIKNNSNNAWYIR